MIQSRKTRLPLEHLRAWRMVRLLTQQELADRAGLSISTVVRIEATLGLANLATVRALAWALGITPERLAFGGPPGSPDDEGAWQP